MNDLVPIIVAIIAAIATIIAAYIGMRARSNNADTSNITMVTKPAKNNSVSISNSTISSGKDTTIIGGNSYRRSTSD